MWKRTVYVIVILLLFLQATMTLRLAYATDTRMSVNPNSLIIPPGGNITVAITVTNVTDLMDWEVAIQYNASVINCSSAWVPENNVFQGQTFIPAEPVINAPTVDGLNYTLMGATLLSGSAVNVSSGTLFQINFTAVENGNTSIIIGTKTNPIGSWYSYLLDSDFNEMQFTEDNGLASVGATNVTVFPTSGLGLTFANVKGAGSVTANETSTVQAPPLNNTVGPYYDVKVTASYSGNVTVSLAYDDSNLTQQQEDNLQMMQYTPIPGDIRPDYGKVDMRDIGYIAKRFGTNATSPLWDPAADITGPTLGVPDGKVDMRDIGLCAKNFGNTSQWMNITTYVDTANNVIYGETTHFSLIGIH